MHLINFFYRKLEFGPLCPSLLPDVVRCFSQYFDIGLLGVKHRPPLSLAFDILMEKRKELLTAETATKYFSYFNKLDGLNRTFIQRISTTPFIPLPGLFLFLIIYINNKIYFRK
jgi:hypothetical protein